MALLPSNHAELADRWRAARPFPHIVVDDALGRDGLLRIRGAVAQEPHFEERGALYELMSSAERPTQPALVEFNESLCARETLRAVRAVTGARVSHGHVRSYVYLPGSFLLPHTDWDPVSRRRVAIVCYLSEPGACAGGELELFDCELLGGDIVTTRPTARIAPGPGRLVMFEVSRASLHQVREVLTGARVSLAGWFYE